MTLSSSQKVSIPRPFFSRDLRAIAGGPIGAASVASSQIGGAAASGINSSTMFTPAARVRRVTSSAANSAVNSVRFGSGVTGSGIGGPSVSGGSGAAGGAFSALNNPHLLAKYGISSTSSTTGKSNVLGSAQRQVNFGFTSNI